MWRSNAALSFEYGVLRIQRHIRGRHKISVSNVSDIGTYCIVPFSVEGVGMNIDLCDLLFCTLQFTRRRFPNALVYDLTANDTSHFGTIDPTVNSSATRLAIAND